MRRRCIHYEYSVHSTRRIFAVIVGLCPERSFVDVCAARSRSSLSVRPGRAGLFAELFSPADTFFSGVAEYQIEEDTSADAVESIESK